MVGVAQLVEHRVVVPVAAGSSPVAHPKISCAPLARISHTRSTASAQCSGVLHRPRDPQGRVPPTRKRVPSRASIR